MAFHAAQRPTLSAFAAAFATLLMLPTVAGAQDSPARPAGLDVPYVPTPQEVVDRMLQIADVKGTDYVIDLGCGDGRMPITAAKVYGAKGFGVDLNPVRIEEANANAKREGVTDKVSFEVKNLFDTKIADASVMTMYLLPSVNLQLRPRILNEMKPGTRIVSHAFDMGDWEPDQQETIGYRSIYFWIVPAKVEGRWTLNAGGETIAVDLKQQFQKIDGTATIDGKPVRLQNAALRGDQIVLSFDGGSAGPRTFVGKVDGSTITALDALPAGMKGDNVVKGWSGKRA